ncbi:MAG: metallophosphoesterase [Lachnospiraceae bacterium]|nr:metallophosphoesterase [Lachnospiraceae bacterium]
MITEKNQKWIYTYDYAPESVWEPWRTEEAPAAWIDDEADRVAARVREGLPCFLLLTDSHYTVNGTWEDTRAALQALNRRLSPAGLVHLGDLTDGLLPAARTEAAEALVIGDMKSLGIPVYIVPGNHDYNYFRGNPEIRYPSRPQFAVDLEDLRLRMLFIDSFDPKETVRYGFTDYAVHWLEASLALLPEGWQAVIFAHLTPLIRLQAWTKDIRNREKLIGVLNAHANRILAYINGHNHCDHLFNELYNGAFPVISINCAKCEYFTEHKPEGAVVPYRALGDRTQESFDVLQIDTENRKLYFTRFGAGDDRIVENGRARFL